MLSSVYKGIQHIFNRLTRLRNVLYNSKLVQFIVRPLEIMNNVSRLWRLNRPFLLWAVMPVLVVVAALLCDNLRQSMRWLLHAEAALLWPGWLISLFVFRHPVPNFLALSVLSLPYYYFLFSLLLLLRPSLQYWRRTVLGTLLILSLRTFLSVPVSPRPPIASSMAIQISFHGSLCGQ
jgi:hypothetical protein